MRERTGEPSLPDLCQGLEETVEPVFLCESDFVYDDGPWVVASAAFDCSWPCCDLVDASCRISNSVHAFVVACDPDFRVPRLFRERRCPEPVDDCP